MTLTTQHGKLIYRKSYMAEGTSVEVSVYQSVTGNFMLEQIIDAPEDLDRQIKKLKDDKDAAILEQNYDKASELRERTVRLMDLKNQAHNVICLGKNMIADLLPFLTALAEK